MRKIKIRGIFVFILFFLLDPAKASEPYYNVRSVTHLEENFMYVSGYLQADTFFDDPAIESYVSKLKEKILEKAKKACPKGLQRVSKYVVRQIWRGDIQQSRSARALFECNKPR